MDNSGMTFEIGKGVVIGKGRPLTLLAGPCVLEKDEICNQIASCSFFIKCLFDINN